MLEKMKTSKVPSLLSLLILLFCKVKAVDECIDHRVAGYLPDYRPFNCSFEFIPYAQELLSRANISNLEVYLTFGGGGRSEQFLNILYNNQSGLITSLIEIYGTNMAVRGFDFNPEVKLTTEQWSEYESFLQRLKRESPREMKVSVALHHWQTLSIETISAIDRINIMTYDLEYGQHSSIERTKAIISNFLSKGFKPEKIFIGLPLYGRHEDDPHKVLTYSDIISCDSVLKGNETDVETSKRSFHDGYHYNGLIYAEFKANLIKLNKLGGIFFWEVGQDCLKDSFSVIQKVNSAFNN